MKKVRKERVLPERVDMAVVQAKLSSHGKDALGLTTEEVAAALGVSLQRVHDLTSDGRLARRWAVRAGYHPDDVRAFRASVQNKETQPCQTKAR
jgi:hypothetical protein